MQVLTNIVRFCFNWESMHTGLSSYSWAWKKRRILEKTYRKSDQKEPEDEMCLLILNLKAVVKGKHHTGRVKIYV